MHFLAIILAIFLGSFRRQSWAQLLCTNPRTIFATASTDNTIQIWDLDENAQCMITLSGHNDDVEEIAFSKDQKYIFSTSIDKTIKVWDLETGNLIKTLTEHNDWVNGLDISPDSELIASVGNENIIIIWSAKNFSLLRTIKSEKSVNRVRFSPDGVSLICGESSGIVEVFEIKSGTRKIRITPHTKDVLDIFITSDKKYLVTGSTDNTAKMLDINSMQPVREFKGHTGWVRGVAVNSKNTILATASSDTTILIWDTKTGALLKNLSSHTSHVLSLKFTLNGNFLLSGSCDKTIKFWDVELGTCVKTLSTSDCVSDIKIAELCLQKVGSISKGDFCNCGNQLSFPTENLKVCTKINMVSCQNCTGCDMSCETCSYEGSLNCLSCNPASDKPYHEYPTVGDSGQCLKKCLNLNGIENGDSPYADDINNRCYSICPKPRWGVNTTAKCENSCPAEYYKDEPTRECKICNKICATCLGPLKSHCLSCKALSPNPYHELPMNNTEGTCLEICNDPYPFSDDTTNRCYSICPFPRWGLGLTKKCEASCPYNYFKYETARECRTCDKSCATCSGPLSSHCLSCIPLSNNSYHEFPNAGVEGRCLSTCGVPNPFAHESSGKCYNICPVPTWGDSLTLKCENSCSTNYYPDSNRQCQKCHPNCYTCSGNLETECLSCKGLNFPYHESSTAGLIGQCLIKCVYPNSYMDIATNRCFSMCPEPLWGYSKTGKCEFNCPSDHFQDFKQRVCAYCPENCLTCTDSLNCLSCASGYYFSSDKCLNCPSNCRECRNSGECLSCEVGYVLDEIHCKTSCSGNYYPNWAEGTCLECRNNEYLERNFTEAKCLKCEAPCLSCKNNAKNCTSCVKGLFWNGTDCADHCQDGKYPIEEFGLCASCHFSCQNCDGSGPRSCTSCPDESFLFIGSCMKVCPEYYFPNRTSNFCEACHISCSKCKGGSKNDCISCPPSRLMNIQKIGVNKEELQGECICRPLYFENKDLNCGRCHVSCSNCTGDGYLDCTRCIGNRGDENQNPFQGRCTCPDNTYDFLEEICKDRSQLSSTIEILIVQKESVKYTFITSIFSFGILRTLGTIFNLVDVAQEINLYSFLKINYPLNLESFLTFLLSFRFFKNFKFFEIEKINQLSEIPTSEYEKVLGERGVSSLFLKNSLSTLIIIFSAPIIFYLITKLIEFLMRKKVINMSKLNCLEQAVYSLWKSRSRLFSQLVSFILMGCLQELHIFAVIQFLSFKNISLFERISLSFSIIWIVVEIFILLYVINAYIRSIFHELPLRVQIFFEKLFKFSTVSASNSFIQDRYPFLFGVLQKDDRFGKSYILFKISKKIVLPSIYALFCTDIESATSILLFTYSGFLLYLRTSQPFKLMIFNILNEITEVGHIAFFVCLKFYTRAVTLNNNELALGLGLYMIYAVVFIVIINSVFILFSFLHIINYKRKELLEKLHKKSVNAREKEEKDAPRKTVLEIQPLKEYSAKGERQIKSSENKKQHIETFEVNIKESNSNGRAKLPKLMVEKSESSLNCKKGTTCLLENPQVKGTVALRSSPDYIKLICSKYDRGEEYLDRKEGEQSARREGAQTDRREEEQSNQSEGEHSGRREGGRWNRSDREHSGLREGGLWDRRGGEQLGHREILLGYHFMKKASGFINEIYFHEEGLSEWEKLAKKRKSNKEDKITQDVQGANPNSSRDDMEDFYEEYINMLNNINLITSKFHKAKSNYWENVKRADKD